MMSAGLLVDYLPQLLLAWSIQLTGVISPGPSVALIMGVATSRGRVPSVVTAFGVACGAVVLATATVLGIAVVFAQVSGVMTVIRITGAAYLVWLAYKAFRTAATPPVLKLAEVRPLSVWRTALAGFLLQITNPKAIVFWLAVASVGGIGDAPASIAVLFIAGAFVNSFAGHGGYALLLSSAPVRAGYQRTRRWIEGALGCFFYTQATGWRPRPPSEARAQRSWPTPVAGGR
ncbi:MAG: LysE family translocator [Rhizobiaceae bacterium]|nr:LysE family translocator [Rhizobiaceae bacterium]